MYICSGRVCCGPLITQSDCCFAVSRGLMLPAAPASSRCQCSKGELRLALLSSRMSPEGQTVSVTELFITARCSCLCKGKCLVNVVAFCVFPALTGWITFTSQWLLFVKNRTEASGKLWFFKPVLRLIFHSFLVPYLLCLVFLIKQELKIWQNNKYIFCHVTSIYFQCLQLKMMHYGFVILSLVQLFSQL